MLVNEIFPSIQGEGTFIGTPAIFIRFQGCNLKCIWCDTKYALKEGGKCMMTPYEILKVVDKLAGPQLCILTGGEPLIQPAGDMEFLVGKLLNRNLKVHIETNGTIEPHPYLRHMVDHWIVSPKLSSSGMRHKLNMDTLTKFMDIHNDVMIIHGLNRSVEFKFVVANETDFVEALRIVKELELEPIIMQPCNNDPEIGREIVKLIHKYSCHRFRVIPQYHKTLWGNQRGR